MVIWIPWGDISPPHLLSPQVCILSTTWFFLLGFLASSGLPLRITLSSPVCLLSPHLRRFIFSFLSLNVFFYSHLFPLSVFILLSLWSSPLVRASREERSRGRKGMLILSPQWQSREGETEIGERGKCHLSEEMRWPLHSVCVCVCVCMRLHWKIRVTVWVTLCVFLCFTSLSKWDV